MKSRKELKKQARKTIKKHYFRSVLLVFICSVLLAGGFTYSTKDLVNINFYEENVGQLLGISDRFSNSKIINEMIDKTKKIQDLEAPTRNDEQIKYTRGILSVFINETTSSGSIVFGILNGINKLVFHEKIASAILIFGGNILLFVFNVIFIDVLVIGKNRFFLEKRRYYDTRIEKLFYPYKNKKTLHLAYILFIRAVYQFLWNLTIIGGFIKYYEYSMIPYILAENPSISKKDAFRLSKQLTQGRKFELFKITLSFLGWDILSIITFKLSSVFYSDIYKEAVWAEIYMNLREEEYNVLPVSDKNLLNDELLDIEFPVESAYPEDKFEHLKTRRIFKIDYNREYSLQSYILLFFTFSFIGWIWEVFLFILETGTLVNRGTMYGPWLPIYGAGGVLILFLLKRFREKPILMFLSAFILCGIVEYGTAWYLETFKHLRYWDYSGYFVNIKGRICLEGLIVFGLGGCGFTYLLAPLFDNLYRKINPKIVNILCIVLVLLFMGDCAYTHIHPHTGQGISQEYVEEY